MTQMIAVGDGGDNIEAFLNGSDFAEDTEVDPHTNDPCGKLILAAGIPKTAENGSIALEERAKEATTRIYEDGCTYTKNLHLQEGCRIGQIRVTDYAFSLETQHGGRIAITEAGGFESINYINVIANVGGMYGQGISVATQKGLDLGLGLAYGRPIGITIDAGEDEEAIRCNCGIFSGLRPRCRTVSSETKLDNLDHTIVCFREDGGAIYLELPETPMLGQCYEIWKLGDCEVHLDGWETDIIRIGVSTDITHGINRAFVGVLKLLYDGIHWLLTLHRTE